MKWLLITTAVLTLTACATKPDGTVAWDLGTTAKALSCANIDLSDPAERKRCHIFVGK